MVSSPSISAINTSKCKQRILQLIIVIIIVIDITGSESEQVPAAANAVDSSPPPYPSELPPPYIQQPGYQAPPSYEVPPGYQGPPAYQTLPGYPAGQVYQGVPVGYVVATVSFEFVDLQIPVVD